MSERAVIAYWGPGLSGKSTNLSVVREVLAGRVRDDQESSQLVEVAPDRVLFDLGAEGPQLELFAPPGQAHHRLLRQEGFVDVDGVVFVADSSAGAVAVNLAALDELELFAASRNQELNELALVFQFNKRDLCDALEVSRLQELLNPSGRPSVEAIATRGVGVFPSLKAVARELRSCGRTAQMERAAGQTGASLQGGEVAFIGDESGGEEEALEPLVTDDGSIRGRVRTSLHWAGSLHAKWSLVLAALLGALAREVLELGWRLSMGGG